MRYPEFYQSLIKKCLEGEGLSVQQGRDILTSNNIDLLPLLDAAYQVRKKFFGRDVLVHVLNNVQNGLCPEDCHYCVQSKNSHAAIETYPMKPDEEILAEAKEAYESGAFRYCMVFSGRVFSRERIDHLCGLIKKIKATYPLEVCVSPGFIDEPSILKLKEAGLDRLNHNLNTSERFYPSICSTHTFSDRLHTLKAARKVGLEVCSGVIVGMGEDVEDVIDVALNLRTLKARSIPVNFLLPLDGIVLGKTHNLTPEYCLRVLCLYRFLNPDAEIRVAAGREVHLREMQVMALYPANSLFMRGYLNAKGASRAKTLRMIKDAGFVIKSDINLDEILAGENGLEEGALEGYLEIK